MKVLNRLSAGPGCAGVLAIAAFVAPRAMAQGCGGGWSSTSGGPPGRSGMVMAYDPFNSRVLMFGGTVSGVFSQATWSDNGGSWVQLFPSFSPSARDGSALSCDLGRHVMTLFSGYSGRTGTGIIGGYENATWEFFSGNWSVRTLVGPAPRAGHVMAYIPGSTNRTLLFGGSNRPNLSVPTTRLSDTWLWNSSSATWTQLNIPGPSARDTSAMCYDSLRGVAVLFGGFSVNGLDAETWEWDPSTQAWTQIYVSGPSGRYNHRMVYDDSRGVSVLFGGSSNGLVNDTWQYSGGAWSRLLTTTTPGARMDAGLAYDSARQRLVLFGGQSGFNYLADAWEGNFRNWPVVYAGPISAFAEDGCSVTFDVSAASMPVASDLTYQWRFNGSPISDDGHYSGTNTPTLTISGVTGSDVGNLEVVVSSACGSVISTPATPVIEGPPTILTSPTDVTTCTFGPAAFSVVADSYVPLTYQWQYFSPDGLTPDWVDLVEGDNLVDTFLLVNASGAQSASLTLTRDGLAWTGPSGGQVRCIVSSACTSLTSDPATINVCISDVNCDLITDLGDFFQFLNDFDSTLPGADVNGDGSVDLGDFFAFLNAFDASC